MRAAPSPNRRLDQDCMSSALLQLVAMSQPAHHRLIPVFPFPVWLAVALAAMPGGDRLHAR